MKWVFLGIVVGILAVVGLSFIPVHEPLTYTPTTYPVPSEILPVTKKLGLPDKLEVEVKLEEGDCASEYEVYGCYSHNTIYFPRKNLTRSLQDQSVTFAHEYLHFVWFAKMSESQRQQATEKVKPLYYKIQKRMSVYPDPQRPTELYSVLCTEYDLDCTEWIPNGV